MTRPPRLAEWLLGALIASPAWRDAILGDLREDFAAYTARRRLVLAHLWYWSQVLRLAVRHAGRRRPTRAGAAWRGDSLTSQLTRDLRFALRMLRRRPTTSAVIVITLAFGLATNAAVFSIVDAMVFRPFPIPRVDRLVMLSETSRRTAFQRANVAPATYFDLKRQTDVFSRLTAYRWWDVNLSGRDEPERVQGFLVSADFFPALGVEPVVGRTFTPDEETPGHDRTLILGFGLWQRRFAGDPNVVGQVVLADGEPYEVVGVAPPGWSFPYACDVWAPLAFTPAEARRRDARFLTVVGRLRAGVTVDEARAQVALVGARIARAHPETHRAGVALRSLSDALIDEGTGAFLGVWQAAAVFVLLIACANVASLLLARGPQLPDPVPAVRARTRQHHGCAGPHAG